MTAGNEFIVENGGRAGVGFEKHELGSARLMPSERGLFLLV